MKNNNDFNFLLGAIGQELAGSWCFTTKMPVFSDDLIDLLLSRKMHKYKLYDDIDWYIVQHCDTTKNKIKNLKNISSVYLLIEVNGDLCEECLEDELKDILSAQAYGGSAGKRRVEKAFWEAIEYIKRQKENK